MVIILSQTTFLQKINHQFIIFIGCIIAILMAGFITNHYQLKASQSYAHVINISGKQRMLSQRIIHLSLLLNAAQTSQASQKNIKALKKAIDTFQNNHFEILYSDIENKIYKEHSETIKNYFFSEPLNLNERVNDFISRTNNIIQLYENNAPVKDLESYLEYLNTNVRDNLLNDLNRVVNQYELEAENNLKHFRFVQFLTFMSSLFLLLLTLIFVFFPLFKKYQKRLDTAEEVNSDIKQQIAFNESLLANVIDNIPAILFGKDVTNCYTYNIINKAAAEFFGYPKEELLGGTDYDFFEKDEANFFRNTDIGVIAGGKVVDIPCEQVTTKHGTMFVHTRKVPIFGSNGEAKILLGIVEDITERLKNEIELEKYQKNLEKMVEDRTEKLKVAAEKEKELNRLKSEFLATMSHEIRTPMNGILGMTELILGARPSEQIENYAKTVINSGESLLQIIDDILDFSKIEAGKLKIDPMPIDMLKIADEIASLFAVRARDKAIELIVHYRPGSEQFIYADPIRLRQILGNLISNAIKFTEKGYVTLDISEVKDDSLQEDETRLLFSIEDTGIGLDKEAKDFIFEKFLQADNSTTRKYGGTGLGLSICQSLVQMMGGEVKVESEKGVGSKFFFDLKFKRNESETYDQPKPPILRNIRILVCDDLPEICKLVSEQLTLAGMRCDSALSGKQALEMMHQAYSANDPYKMVIIDYLMPEMNGEMLASAIYDHDYLREACLIMLTAAGNPLADDLFVQRGFSAYIPKPIQNQKFINSIALVWEKYSGGHTDKLIRIDSKQNLKETVAQDHLTIDDKKILIAEDNLVNQVFIKEILEDMGAICTIVSNGEDAVKAVKEEEYDLIIMDCLMPVMDGFEATRKICSMKEKGDTRVYMPIIALTANAMEGDRQKCLNAGMDDYATKPIRKDQIKQMVFEWVNGKSEDDKDKIRNNNVSSNSPDKRIDIDIDTESDLLDIESVKNAQSILKSKFDEMVPLFFENSWERVSEIETAVNDNDFKTLQRSAHTLKSTGRQMGALRLSNIALKIETLSKEKNSEHIDTTVTNLKTCLAETKSAFESHLKS